MKDEYDLIRFFQPVPMPSEGEEQLARQLKTVMNWMPGGFFIYWANGGEEILYANDAMIDLFGCTSEEEFRAHVGNSFRGIVHPDDLEEVEKSIWEQISGEKSHLRQDLDYVEYRIVRKDGEVRWVDDYGHFIRSEVGDVFCVFVSDATEEKLLRLQREKNLESRVEAYHQELEGISQEYLRRLEVIEGLSADYESIFYVDLAADTIQTYQLSERLGGQFEQTGRTRRFSQFAVEYVNTWVCPEDRPAVEQFLSCDGIRSNLSERRMFDVNYRIVGEENEYFQLHMVNSGSATPVNQVILGARNVGEVIRSGLRQKEVLETALHQANSAVVAKNAFLANMSHDMRTPMNAILGFTALARKHLDDGGRTEGYLDMIETAGNQLLHLVNDVLEIARMEAGKIQLEESTCDLAEVICSVVEHYAGAAADKRQVLEMDIGQIRHRFVHSDREKLSQLLSVLVDNGVKYTPDGGRIQVVAEEVETENHQGYGTYHLLVSDTGIGIGEEFMSKMFLPFERQKNTTSSRVPGTGLGLSIAKSIVDVLGGSIHVDSTPGQGSRFAVTLTLRLAEKDRTRTDGSERQAPGQAEIGKILLVEDNELNLEIERELLEGEGFRVDTAADGSIAVDMVKASAPGEYAVILMDIQMPVMDGYEATRAIRALPDPALAAIPIVAVSANAFDEDKKKSSQCGMNDHIPKPVDITRLVNAIWSFAGPAREQK